MMLLFNSDDFFPLHYGTAFIAFAFGARVSCHNVSHPCVSGHKQHLNEIIFYVTRRSFVKMSE